MRNLGVIVLIIGLLLLILPKWFITVVGILAILSGLFAIVYPEKATDLIAKFGSKGKKEGKTSSQPPTKEK